MSPLTEVEPEAVQRNVLIVSTTLTGLMVLEYVWNLRFEMRVIWPRYRESYEIKLFLIARYVGLIAQISNMVFSRVMTSGISIHLIVCRIWYGYETVINQTLIVSVGVHLMSQVYRLCNRHKNVRRILVIFGVTQCAAMTVSAWMVIPRVAVSRTCTLTGSHAGQIYLGVSTIAIHQCLLAVMLWRYFRSNWPEPLASFLKITVRDCTFQVIVVTANFLLVALIPMGLKLPLMISNIIYHLLIISMWFAACRPVIHRENFRHKNRLELTVVDLDNPGPSMGSDIWPVELSDDKVPTEAIAVDPELDVGTKDIADEHLSNSVDDNSPSRSSCISTVLRVESVNNDSHDG